MRARLAISLLGGLIGTARADGLEIDSHPGISKERYFDSDRHAVIPIVRKLPPDGAVHTLVLRVPKALAEHPRETIAALASDAVSPDGDASRLAKAFSPAVDAAPATLLEAIAGGEPLAQLDAVLLDLWEVMQEPSVADSLDRSWHLTTALHALGVDAMLARYDGPVFVVETPRGAAHCAISNDRGCLWGVGTAPVGAPTATWTFTEMATSGFQPLTGAPLPDSQPPGGASSAPAPRRPGLRADRFDICIAAARLGLKCEPLDTGLWASANATERTYYVLSGLVGFGMFGAAFMAVYRARHRAARLAKTPIRRGRR